MRDGDTGNTISFSTVSNSSSQDSTTRRSKLWDDAPNSQQCGVYDINDQQSGLLYEIGVPSDQQCGTEAAPAMEAAAMTKAELEEVQAAEKLEKAEAETEAGATKLAEISHFVACPSQWLPVLLATVSQPPPPSPPPLSPPPSQPPSPPPFARNSSCSSGTCTFDCAIDNHRAQVAAAPGYYYAQANHGLSESNSKQPLSATWEPLLEAVPGCNGLGNGELLEISFLVVLDASWVAYFAQHKEDFAAQGYATLEASPRLMFDRLSYLFEAQAPRAQHKPLTPRTAPHTPNPNPILPERSSVFASQSAASKPLQTSLKSAQLTTRSWRTASKTPATPTTPWSSAASPMPRASRAGLCDSVWGPLMARPTATRLLAPCARAAEAA